MPIRASRTLVAVADTIVVLSAAIGIVVPILDFLGLLEHVPLLTRRIPILTLLIVGLVLVHVVLERRLRLDKMLKAMRELNLPQLRDDYVAARGLLGPIGDNQALCRFLYSYTPVNERVDVSGTPIDLPYKGRELQVTTIADARGIACIHSVLHLVGKTELLDATTHQQFENSWWAGNLILIGSQRSNPTSQQALSRFGSPYKFREDAKAIIKTSGKRPTSWVFDRDNETYDYGVIAKLGGASPQKPTYFVFAGIGAFGTEACCYYFQSHLVELHRRFGARPFACVIRVDRTDGYSLAKMVASCAV